MDLPPSINQALAAAIIDAGRETTTGCTANDPTKPFVGVFRLAQALRSQATGAVRASIDRIFDNPDETLEDLAILPFLDSNGSTCEPAGSRRRVLKEVSNRGR
jgi:hypothetical protein